MEFSPSPSLSSSWPLVGVVNIDPHDEPATLLPINKRNLRSWCFWRDWIFQYASLYKLFEFTRCFFKVR